MNNSVTKRPTSLLESFLGDDYMNNPGYGTGIDIFRSGTDYRVELEMPGFTKEEIDIDFKGDLLTITAQHEEKEETEGSEAKEYFYRSRNTRRVKRQIRFADVDHEGIDATYVNGVLSIVLPCKTLSATAKKISVR